MNIFSITTFLNIPFCLCHLALSYCFPASVSEYHHIHYHTHRQCCPLEVPFASLDGSEVGEKNYFQHHKLHNYATVLGMSSILTCFIIIFLTDSFCKLSPTEVYNIRDLCFITVSLIKCRESNMQIHRSCHLIIRIISKHRWMGESGRF